MNWEKAVPGKVIQLQLSSGTSRVTSIRDSRIFSAPTARSLGGIASLSFSRTRVFHVPNYWNDETADGAHSSPPSGGPPMRNRVVWSRSAVSNFKRTRRYTDYSHTQ